MAKKSDNGRVTLPGGAWLEIAEGLYDMPMADMADWVDCERAGKVRETWVYMARAVAAWSWEMSPDDPASFGRLSLREYRAVSNAVTQAMQEIAKN